MCSFIYLPISAGHSCFALVLFSATFAPVFPTDLDASDLHALPRLRGVLPVPRLLCHSLIPCRSPVPSWQKSWNTRAIFRDNQDSEGLSPVWTGFHVLPRLGQKFGISALVFGLFPCRSPVIVPLCRDSFHAVPRLLRRSVGKYTLLYTSTF